MTDQKFTLEQIRAAHGKSSGNLDTMLLFLEGKKRKELTEWVKTIPDLCEVAHEKESDYDLPVNGTDEQMRDAYWKRLELQEIVFNGGKNLDMVATPDEERYYVGFVLSKDEEAPFGFRLSYYACGCVRDFSRLGARPEFRKKQDAIYCFNTWTSDYEGFIYYYNKCKQNKNRKL